MRMYLRGEQDTKCDKEAVPSKRKNDTKIIPIARAVLVVRIGLPNRTETTSYAKSYAFGQKGEIKKGILVGQGFIFG